MVKKIIYWKNKLNGFIGCGSSVEGKITDLWINAMNAKYLDIDHCGKIIERLIMKKTVLLVEPKKHRVVI